MAAINADADVMQFFPAVQTLAHTEAFVARMQKLMVDKGYCYYAIDKLEDGSFIGFTGLCEQTFAALFTPCIDIGWRLSKAAWNKGYATEAASRCLHHAFYHLHIPTIYAIAPEINTRSIRIMEKVGMHKVDTFIHPLLRDDERLKTCVLYTKHKI